MKRYAETQDEMAAILGMSGRQFRTYSSRPDAPSKTRSGYNVAHWIEYVKEVKKQGLTGDGSLKDEKLKREIELLDLKIAREADQLVDRAETIARYRAKLQSYRSKIEAWRAHEIAKQPVLADQITKLADRLIEEMRNDEAD